MKSHNQTASLVVIDGSEEEQELYHRLINHLPAFFLLSRQLVEAIEGRENPQITAARLRRLLDRIENPVKKPGARHP